MFIIKQLKIDHLHNDSNYKKEFRKYDFTDEYFGYTFIDYFNIYLSLTYYNSIPFDFKRNVITCV